MRKSDYVVAGLSTVFCAAAIGFIGVNFTGLPNPNPEEPRKTLRDNGFTVVEPKGNPIFGCGQGDIFRDRFVVKNPQGQTLEVTVCGGFLKGNTLRF